MKISPTICALFTLAMAGSSNAATTVYSSGFTTPAYADGALVGQDGWAQTGTIATTPIQVANTATNGNVTLTSGQDVFRAFPFVSTSGSAYFSATISVTATTAGGDYFIHFGDGGSSAFYARTYVKSTTGGYLIGMGASSGAATYGTTILTLSTPYEILVRYDFIAGATNDIATLYLSPTSTPDGTGAAYVSATATAADASSSASGISSINLRQGGSGAFTVVVDNLVVSLDPIPEPSSALLGSLGLLGLIRRRR